MRSLTTVFSALAFSTALVAALPASAALNNDSSNSRSVHSDAGGKIHSNTVGGGGHLHSNTVGGGGGHLHSNTVGGGGHHINHDSGVRPNSKVNSK